MNYMVLLKPVLHFPIIHCTSRTDSGACRGCAYSTTADIYSHLSTAAMDEPASCIAGLLAATPEKELAEMEKGS